MKLQLLTLMGFAALPVCAQSSVNSGAVSGTALIHTVGEIYVLPENPNQTASGTVGAVSATQLLVLGVSEVQATAGIRVYPNPTAHSVFFENLTQPVSLAEVHDLNGRMVLKETIINNQLDLNTLQSGTYIITINNNKNQSFKVIRK